nr:MAG TPA: hypothetical protein [Caudoviricetes sp.]
MNAFYSLLTQSEPKRTGSPVYIPKRSQVIKNKINRARAQRNKRK